MAYTPDPARICSAATLVYDTRTSPRAAGVRAVAQRARRLLFAVDRIEIVFEISPEPRADRVRIVGQVLDAGAPVEDAAVSVCGPRALVDRATDADGEFRFSDLPKGHYGLDLVTATRLVRVSALDVD
jgi:hypothetical protein